MWVISLCRLISAPAAVIAGMTIKAAAENKDDLGGM
jgi:hypothetical protein